MKNIFQVIKASPLFQGIVFSDFEKMFNCLGAKNTLYKKNEILLLAGSTVNFVGLVLSGGVKIIQEDIDGRTMILAKLSAPEMFGEVFACAGVEHSPVTILATTDCQVFFLNYRKIITSCSGACPFHARLIENMLRLIAEKNLLLNQKIELLSKRTIREKLLFFLQTQKGMASKITIPYNREELANYLCVDRSALSNELSKLQNEGLIKFQKNDFEILGRF